MLNPETATRHEVEAAITAWRDARARRLAADKEAAKLKSEEAMFKSMVLESFKAQKFEGMIIGGRSTGLTAGTAWTVTDPEALRAHIRSTGEIDLLEFRLSKSAVADRAEDGVEVPGTATIEVFDLYDRKV